MCHVTDAMFHDQSCRMQDSKLVLLSKDPFYDLYTCHVDQSAHAPIALFRPAVVRDRCISKLLLWYCPESVTQFSDCLNYLIF
jgi:hypothetical protein